MPTIIGLLTVFVGFVGGYKVLGYRVLRMENELRNFKGLEREVTSQPVKCANMFVHQEHFDGVIDDFKGWLIRVEAKIDNLRK
jgi:hypothetical protein